MIPLGRVGRNYPSDPGNHGPEHDSLLNDNEQQTLMTLWCIARSPLIFGGDMAKLDTKTLALLTNPEVIEMNQKSAANRQLFRYGDIVAWIADVAGCADKYLAVFNLSDTSAEAVVPLSQLANGTRIFIRDLWQRKDIGFCEGLLKETIPSHGSVLYRIRP
jgi:hypothetical protein